MKKSTIKKAAAFFYPFLKAGAYVVFYGGEPLLAFDKLEYAVSLFEEEGKGTGRRINFSLSTNGSLITDEILRFFNRHGFSVILSFDGLAQDISRKPGTLKQMPDLIKGIHGYPGIKLSINSVFSTETVSSLYESLRFIIDAEGTDISFHPATLQPWPPSALLTYRQELKKLTNFLVSFYKEKGKMPVENFTVKPGEEGKIFFCLAGRERLALTPEGKLWGCHLFHDYLEKKPGSPGYREYLFGELEDFIDNHEALYPKVAANYSALRQDFFYTEKGFCFLCQEVNHCTVCPINSAYASGIMGKIPAWVCELHQIQLEEKKRFFHSVFIST